MQHLMILQVYNSRHVTNALICTYNLIINTAFAKNLKSVILQMAFRHNSMLSALSTRNGVSHLYSQSVEMEREASGPGNT